MQVAYRLPLEGFAPVAGVPFSRIFAVSKRSRSNFYTVSACGTAPGQGRLAGMQFAYLSAPL
jgi:hypothetical protein